MGHCVTCHESLIDHKMYCRSAKCARKKCYGLGIYDGLCERHSMIKAPNLKKCHECCRLHPVAAGHSSCSHSIPLGKYQMYTVHEDDVDGNILTRHKARTHVTSWHEKERHKDHNSQRKVHSLTECMSTLKLNLSSD